jgi:hypothetical protein
MEKRLQLAEFRPWFCVAVLVSVYAQQLLVLGAISNKSMLIKIAYSVLYLSTLALCFRPGIQFVWERLSPPLMIAVGCLAVYPLLRITMDVFRVINRQALTDGFLLYGAYYLTAISGAACLQSGILNDIRMVILRFVSFSIPIAMLNGYFIMKYFDYRMNFGHCLANNFLIIIGLLILCYGWKSNVVIAGFGVVGLLILSALINSRSIMLIGCYLMAAYGLIALIKHEVRNVALFFFVILVVVLSANFVVDSGLLQNQEMKADMELLKDKFATDTLFEAFKDSWDNTDFSYIYYWSGNSRSGIIQDAFCDFSTGEWLLGRGIFGVYFAILGKDSLYRSTVEMGFLQELFRWGIPYVLILLLVNFWGIFLAFKYFRKSHVFYFLIGVIVIRVLDIMVYGLAENNVAVLFWWFVLFFVLAKAPVLKVSKGRHGLLG